MNRQGRRNTGTYTKPLMISSAIVEKHVQAEIDNIYKQAQSETVKSMLQVFALALNNEFSFGADRINRALNRTLTQYNCLKSGDLQQQDIIDFCKSKGLQIL